MSDTPWIRIEDAGRHAGDAVEIRGWLYNARSSGSIHFLQIRDGSGLMQAVMAKADVAVELFNLAEGLAQESSVIVRGRVREDRRAPGGYELAISDLSVVQAAELTKLQAVRPPFPRLTYDDALSRLAEAGKTVPWGEDFGADEETVLSAAFDRPLFVHHYPARCKAFYMQPDPQRPELVLSADLLAPEGYGEIIGGGQRIHDLALVERRLREYKLPAEVYQWYLDLRRYGSVPHSGFGLGIERTVAWICGIEHVREAIPFPRLLNRLYP